MKHRQSTLIALALFGLQPIVGMAQALAQPDRPLPAEVIAVDNARKYFLEAAALLVDKEKIGSKLSPGEERRLVEANRAALARLREGFQFRFQPLRYREDAQTAILISEEHRKYRMLARLLIMEGRDRQARGDVSGAFDSYLDAMQLGHEITRDGMMINAMVGYAVASIGRYGAWEALPLLDAPTAKRIAARVEKLRENGPSFINVLRAEARFGEGETRRNAQDIGQVPGHPPIRPETVERMVGYYRELMEWEIAAASQPYVVSGQKQQRDLLDDTENENEGQQAAPIGGVARLTVERMFDQTRNVIRTVRFLDTREQTLNALLLGQLALLAHRLEHKTAADDWKLLVPAILKQAPPDPFGFQEPLRLVKQGEVFVPYSIGPDGIDDGGLPILSKQPKTAPERRVPLEWDSSGDIVAGINR